METRGADRGHRSRRGRLFWVMANPVSRKPHNDAPTHDRVNRPPRTVLASRLPLRHACTMASTESVHGWPSLMIWRGQHVSFAPGRFGRAVTGSTRNGVVLVGAVRVLFDRAPAVPRLRPGRYSTAIGFRGACPSIIRNRWNRGMLEAISGRMRIWTEQRVHCCPSPESSGSCSGERPMPLLRDRWRRRLLLTNSLR